MSGAKQRPVLLINLEGADRDLLNRFIDLGQLPHISALIEQGCYGALASPSPLVPAMLFNSLLTGTPAPRHGILAAQSAAAQPIVAGDRHSPALWEIGAAEGLNTCSVGGWATHGSRDSGASIVSEFFGAGNLTTSAELIQSAIQPAALRAQLDECWLAPEEVDLETIAWFVPNWREIDQDTDPRLAWLANTLAGNLSRHACYLSLLAHQSPDLAVVNYSLLDQLGGIVPLKWQQSQNDAAEHEADSGQARNALLAERAYQLIDSLVGAAVEAADPDATVILTSTHGFQRPTNLAQARQWPSLNPEQRYRNTGFVIAAGQPFQQDELIHGASLYDLVPTILHLFGLPVAEDMPGRVLAECLVDTKAPDYQPSWQHLWQPASDPDGARTLVSDRDRLSDYFQSLGLAQFADRTAEVREAANLQWNWNSARAKVQSNQPAGALPILEDLAEQYPERIDILLELMLCQLKLGLVREARDLVEGLLDFAPDSPAAHLAIARIELSAGRYEPCLDALRQAQKTGASGPLVDLFVAQTNLRLSRWQVALEYYDRVLEALPQNPEAHRGRARALLGLRDFAAAGEAALDAISLNYQHPVPHYLLAVSFMRRHMREEAALSLENTIRLAPNWVVPHLHLIRLKRAQGKPAEEIAAHEERVAVARSSQLDRKKLEADAIERQQERLRQRMLERERSVQEILTLDEEEIVTSAEALNLTLVSGLPRSGCGAALAALERGGLSILSDDGERFDWSGITELPGKPHIITQARDKVVYVPSNLLAFLPRLHHYRIIFIDRPIGELVLSGERNLGSSSFGQLSRAERANLLQRHRSGVLSALRGSLNMSLLVVDYEQLLTMPEGELERIRDFLGEDVLDKPEKMMGAIDSGLCNFRLSDPAMPRELKAPPLQL